MLTFRLGWKITTLFVDVTHKNSSLLVFSTPISIAASCMKTVQKRREVWISKYIVVYIYSLILQRILLLQFGHIKFFSVYSFLVVSRNFNYAINLSCNAVDFNFADSCWFLCVDFRELSHLTRDFSLVEKIINIVTSWSNAKSDSISLKLVKVVIWSEKLVTTVTFF